MLIEDDSPISQNIQDMLGITGEIRTNSWVMFSYGLLHMDTPVLAIQQRFIYFSFVWTIDTVKRTWQEQWTMGTDDKGETGNYAISMT